MAFFSVVTLYFPPATSFSNVSTVGSSLGTVHIEVRTPEYAYVTTIIDSKNAVPEIRRLVRVEKKVLPFYIKKYIKEALR